MAISCCQKCLGMYIQEIESIKNINQESWQHVLIHSRSHIPFLDYQWIDDWSNHFAPESKVRAYALQNGAGEIVGIFPVIFTDEKPFGLNCNIVSFPANSHSFRTDILAKEEQRSALFVDWFKYLQRTQKFDYLKFKEFLYDPSLFDALKTHGIRFSLEEKKQPPYLEIQGSWEDYFKTRKGHFRRNLRRRMRNAQKEFGPVTYRVFDGSDSELEEWIDEGFTLEASGWKGKRGSAILNSEQVKQFYFDIAKHFNARKMLHVGSVFFGDRMVAFNFSLVYDGVFYLLKIAYDESFARYSPGQIMMYHVLQSVFAQGLKGFDFLGPNMPWKREWTDKSHDHYTFLVYGPTWKGRYLYLINSKIAPALRRIGWIRKLKEKYGA